LCQRSAVTPWTTGGRREVEPANRIQEAEWRLSLARDDASPRRLHTRAVSVLEATFGLVSNNRWLLHNPEFFSEYHMQCLLTDVYRVNDVAFGPDLDAYLYLIDQPDVPPSIRVTDRELWCAGPFSQLDAAMVDRRYSVFGNLGLFFKYSMATLERRHGIYSFHASAMYIPDRNELIGVIGGAGAGKTVLILEGLTRGFQIFSVEMLHFAFRDEGVVFFKGALMDNIRVGNLIYDFPKAVERLKIDIPEVADVWGTKIAVDCEPATTEKDVIVNPKVTLLFPRIEAGRDSAIVGDVTSRTKLKHMLFNSATEKIGGTVLLYESIPVESMDTPELMERRLQAMDRFVSGDVDILRAKTILAGTHNCMEGI
jgi:hypothetical protein